MLMKQKKYWDEVDLSEKVVIVTGGNSGMGKETVIALANMGATVILGARDPKRGKAALEEIREYQPKGKILLQLADLSVMSEVRKFASEFKQNFNKLHVLVNNAGGIWSKRILTSEGNEFTIAINHLAPFLLTHLLLDELKAAKPSRVINISSMGHHFGSIDFDNMMGEKVYSATSAYGRAKLALIMQTYEMAKRMKAKSIEGIDIFAVHPGGVRTHFANENLMWRILMGMAAPFLASAAKGARTAVYLASAPEVVGKTGTYWVDKKSQKSSEASYNEENWAKVWDWSTKITGGVDPL